MGYIKEPSGINFIVDSTPLSIEDKKIISEAIAYFKETFFSLSTSIKINI